MLRLPPLEVLSPASWEEAAELLRAHPQARVLAGGTDLLPAMKLGHLRCPALISLRGLPPPRNRVDASELVLDARMPVDSLSSDPLVHEHAPALARAAARVAGPQIRNRATLGGNLCQDVRCRFLNQSELWRGALGGCLKCDGDRCHVVEGGTRCVAAFCSDLAPLLIALDAVLDLTGGRSLPLLELYRPEGRSHLALSQGELIMRVRLPRPGPATRVTSRKWSVRASLDFPMVAVAVRLEAERQVLRSGRAVVGALTPRPRVVPLGELGGRQLGERLARAAGALVRSSCTPLPNLPGSARYRRERLEEEVVRAMEELS